VRSGPTARYVNTIQWEVVRQLLPASYTYRAEVPGRHIDHRCALNPAMATSHLLMLWRSLLAEPAPRGQTVTPILPGDLFNDQRPETTRRSCRVLMFSGRLLTLAIPGALPGKRANAKGDHVRHGGSPYSAHLSNGYGNGMDRTPGIARSLDCLLGACPSGMNSRSRS
jgi:hypothetical protein